MENKNCTKCKISKHLDDFYKRSKDSKSSWCKDCSNANSNKYNQDKMKIKNEYNEKFRQERKDYIYETNPSNYEDWENNTRDYPWGFPLHLQDFIYFLVYHNREDLATFKRNKNDMIDKINYYKKLSIKKDESKTRPEKK
jgi:hypothetical protein